VTDNARYSGNGNGKSKLAMTFSRIVNSPVTHECGAFGIAEGVSMVTSLGVVAVADQLVPKELQSHVYQAVGKVLEPCLLDSFEWAKSKFCKLEECQVDKSKSREERSQEMAKLILVFGSAWAISMAVKLATRRFLNSKFGVLDDKHTPVLAKDASIPKRIAYHTVPWKYWSPEERMIFTADEGVHYGSIFLMNNQGAAVTDDVIKKTASIIHKVTGFSERKSTEIADMLIIWEAPNFMGMLTGFGAIAGKHKLGWPQNNKVLSAIFGGHTSGHSHS
jgi:hypothetical protein